MFADVQSGPLSGPSWRVEAGAFAHLTEDPGADRHDDAGLLGDPDELARRHQPTHRMLPTQERLLGDAIARSEIELRLEQHAQLVALERLAESPLGEQARDRLCVHRLVEQLVRARRRGSWRGTSRRRRRAGGSRRDRWRVV